MSGPPVDSPPPAPAPARRRRRLLRAGVTCGSLVLGLVLAELLVQRVVPIHPGGWFVRSADPDLVYVPAPAMRYEFAGVTYTHGALGLRGRGEPTQQGDGRPRIAFTGDSVGYGSCVSDADALAPQVEALLGGRAEALTLAAPGYNVHQAAARLRGGLETFQGVRAAVYVLCENDVVNATFAQASYHLPWAMHAYDRPGDGPLKALLRRSTLALVAHDRARSLLLGAVDPDALRGAPPATADPRDYSALTAQHRGLLMEPGPYRERFARDLAAMRDAAAAHGVKLACLWVPSEESLILDGRGEYLASLETLCAPLGIELIDGARALRRAPGERLYFDVLHPGAEGHRRLAEGVAAWAGPALGLAPGRP